MSIEDPKPTGVPAERPLEAVPVPGLPLAPQPWSPPPSLRAEHRRDLFWQNTVRESLMALAAAATSGGRLSPTPTGAAHSAGPVDELFDGRIAVVTHRGQRIPIADIHPVFAVSQTGTPADRMRSADVQCTVFRLTTPAGETYTLPISQIAMIHTITDELIKRLEAAAMAAAEDDDDETEQPFGFAAYTSLTKSEEDGPEFVE